MAEALTAEADLAVALHLLCDHGNGPFPNTKTRANIPDAFE